VKFIYFKILYCCPYQCGITAKEIKEATGEQKKAKYSDPEYIAWIS
jgi:hypothetical protein